MSLIQHVTQQEGTDREEALVDLFLSPVDRLENREQASERRLSIQSQYSNAGFLFAGKSVRRVISYDALHRPLEPAAGDTDGGVTQYTVSTFKRAAQVFAVVLACWFASGIVFGFAALKPILVKEGVFRDLCTQEELDEDVEVCYEQGLRLNLSFSLASTTANVSALLVGTMLDRYGPKVCYLIGSACLAAGSIIMSIAFQTAAYDGYTIGNFFLALGGTFVFLPSFQIANAFPKYGGTIVALVTGAFDASAAVYLFYRLAYEATDGAFKPHKFFLFYLIVPVAIVIAQLTFLPTENYKTAPQLELKIQRAAGNQRDVHTSDEDLADDEIWRRRKARSARRRKRLSKLDELVGDEITRKKQEEKHEQHLEASGVWGALHNKTAAEQMLTPWFTLLALLTVVQMVRMNYFIASIRDQYTYMLDSVDLAARVNDFFDWALPLGGVLSTPFLGMLLDNVSTPGVLLLIVIIATAIGIVGSIGTLWAGYTNVLLFVVMRPLYYSAMSDYATKVFGFATFGRVYGTIICFSGMVNLSQTGIDALNKTTFGGNPIPVNAFLAGLTFVIGSTLVVYVAVQMYRMRRKLDQEDAMTVTNTDVGSIMESLLEEDEPRDYGSVAPARSHRDYEQPARVSREYV
ncbi:major facilitator superfamily domain-containing protein [Boeremia exigua]|uniref:major facilitator superfamily domain-containing protein n=1 Tax=Boeremia exigua TaxID=749465 RepID=UPI001E8ECAE1|nr:major facilitator superfamily domain-containing protein [Boeremia exigua]KAH6644614.1 major facilitator superfamily domain-containing protein [Boeremia exigua]